MKDLSWQFFRYLVVGVAGTLIYAAVFWLLNETVLSADKSLSEFERGRNYVLSNSVAFVFSSIFVYLKNRSWVFSAGPHTRTKEISLFYLVAFVAYLIGTPTGTWLIAQWGWNEYYALIVTVAASVLVNFIGRKLLVFSG